jgi:tRNA threonylcarbamoyladenosine biosynthesis protein TsaB
MGEVYWGAFRLGADGIMLPVGDERVCAASAVPDVDGVDWFGAGSGWGAYADSLAARLGRRPPLDAGLTVHAADVARLGAAGLAAGSAVPVDQALPVYLRDRVTWSRS